MSHLLWKYYWENDVDRFRRLLAPAGPNAAHAASKSPAIGGPGGGHLGASPGGPGGTSPRNNPKTRRASGYAATHARSRDGASGLSRAELNSRDHAGLTLLLRAASSTDPGARDFVQALIEHPSIDLYAQDPESGWNALHRALYFGNISIARLLLAKERSDLTNPALYPVSKVGQLIKTKDHEGNSPFDVYNSTIATRASTKPQDQGSSESGSDNSDSEDEMAQISASVSQSMYHSTEGGELYMFGSNKNLSLGVGDEDDRQFPERIMLQRPDELLYRFYDAYLEDQALEALPSPQDVDGIPNLIRNRPLLIQDVAMSKLHTAVLTTDPVSNLYVCGVGRGGRLGLGDENTQFRFVPVQGPFADRKIRQVALGQNHTMAVAGNGELWTFGLNSHAQLGYVLPPPARVDEEPMSLTPRQVFGTLKKEVVVGVAASAIHSVAHTGTCLYCWGKNVGQLALMDADSRSLDTQPTPRRVAASLLSAPIEMVSAIDKATTCLLSNFTVWVFTNYGYNLVKFPVPDILTNHGLAASSFSNRLSPGWKEIKYIASGGETIAAVTARGDLFTMQLNHKEDANPPAGSTTNPVKIKSAVTQPQCVWDSRNDGVTSVSVGEHESVILCTESGAVWKRVKRIKGKAAGFAGSQDAKKKAFKFQRVPYISGCVNVRSSTYGAFAAVRRDKSVLSQKIGIAEQSLWGDVGSLLCLRDLSASRPAGDAGASRGSWEAAIARERPGSVPHEILRCTDVEQELVRWLHSHGPQHGDMDMEVRTTASPEIRIPVHGWILAGRSCVLREAFAAFRRSVVDAANSDSFLLENTGGGKRVLTFPAVDIFTVLNLVVFAYQDTTIPVWRYTRDAPSEAYRFRQVRTELMKMATKLQMPKLEAAARLQAGVERSLDVDLRDAVADPSFFEDGDIVVQLDGADVVVHSQLVCQRCPFFQGMFHGRSQGQWLSQRRGESPSTEQVRIDLRHINVDTFRYVLQYLYADLGEDMFHDVALPTIDDFSELVLDVMGAANELMLDRLSQVCQSVIGKFVTTRNISNLLNEISPCSVAEFKDAGLEYMCVQLECMLENHLLDGLEEELLWDLDQVVRDNQLARFPIARSGRADLLLHERYPDLVMDIDEERQRRVRQMAFKVAQRDEERRLSSSGKSRMGSLDDGMTAVPMPERPRPGPKASRSEQASPTLRPRRSQGDMIFSMDEDACETRSPLSPGLEGPGPHQEMDLHHMPQSPPAWRNGKGKTSADSTGPSPSQLAAQSTGTVHELDGSPELQLPARRVGGPWAPPALPTAKLDLKNIMSEASSKSALTSGLAAQANKSAAAGKAPVRMSQKERKKHLQMQAEAAAQFEQAKQTSEKPRQSSSSRPSPWKAAGQAPNTSLREAMLSEMALADVAPPVKTKALTAPEAETHLSRRRTASPDTRFPGQGRAPCSAAAATGGGGGGGGLAATPKKPLVPHSKSYMRPAPKAEPAIGASMADIIGQQKREQELVREAVAKRSLQEIQQEQAFQEWWDQESRRAQEEEARRQAAKGQDKGGPGNSRRGGRKTRGAAKATAAKASDEAAGTSGEAGSGPSGPRGPSGTAARRGKAVRGGKGRQGVLGA
ncbi:hypothetical protein CDD83_1840 [Cordyceps sp. RAO-2017]|nr:hypothetical protein CDD83_1840 [Cordyceps sp. RAO-2017]